MTNKSLHPNFEEFRKLAEPNGWYVYHSENGGLKMRPAADSGAEWTDITDWALADLWKFLGY